MAWLLKVFNKFQICSKSVLWFFF